MCTAYTGRCLYHLLSNIPILPAESQRSCPGGHAFHPKSTAECVSRGRQVRMPTIMAGRSIRSFPHQKWIRFGRLSASPQDFQQQPGVHEFLGFALRCLRAWIERSNETCPVCRCKEGRAWAVGFDHRLSKRCPRDAQEYPRVVNETPVRAVWVSRVEQEQVICAFNGKQLSKLDETLSL